MIGSTTAELVAAVRASEEVLAPERRIFFDPYARYFLQAWKWRFFRAFPRVGRLALDLYDRCYPGILSEVLLRGRYFDELLAQAVKEGIEQLVLLGAGYDATALRRPAG